jgi:hypothetical protein
MAELVGKANLDELEILQPDYSKIEVDGEIVEVKPFTFGKLLKALKHLSSLIKIFEDMQERGDVVDVTDFLRAFSEHTEDVISLLMLSTGKPREFFEDIDPSAGIDLAQAAYEINKDFFEQNLMPKIANLFPQPEAEQQVEETETKKTKAKKAGSTSSKN